MLQCHDRSEALVHALLVRCTVHFAIECEQPSNSFPDAGAPEENQPGSSLRTCDKIVGTGTIGVMGAQAITEQLSGWAKRDGPPACYNPMTNLLGSCRLELLANSSGPAQYLG